MNPVSFASSLYEEAMCNAENVFIFGTAGAFLGKAVKVFGAANIDPAAVATYCALQSIILRVINAVLSYYPQQNKEVEDALRGGIQLALGIPGSSRITSHLLKYPFTFMQGLLTNLGLRVILIVASKINTQSLPGLLFKNVRISFRPALIWAVGGALIGKTLTVIGAANIDPVAAATFCALQPVVIRVMYAVYGYCTEKNGYDMCSFKEIFTYVSSGILSSYLITSPLLKYSFTPMQALSTNIGLAAMIAVCSAVRGEILYRGQKDDKLEKLKCYLGALKTPLIPAEIGAQRLQIN